MIIPVVGPTYNLEARAFDAQRCVNLFPDASESGASKAPTRLLGCPGLEEFADVLSGPIRGCKTTAGGRSFWVGGDTLFEIDEDGNETDHGQLNTSIGRVSMAENGTQLMIVDGLNGYIFTLATDSLDPIADAQFPNGATVCGFQDTYFLANSPGTGAFYISANNDGTSWAAADSTIVESSPDDLRALLPDHGELFLAGARSMEVYYNSGDAEFPFDRMSQAVLQVGISAAHTLQSFDNSVLWVSEDEKGGRFVYRMTDAYRPTRVSNKAVERALESIADISESYAWVYKQEGHEFYVLQVPGLSSSWVLDAATGLWHERMYYNSELGQEELHRGSCHTFFAGFNLVGDRETGKIYKLRLDVYDDNGDAMHAIRITPHLSNEMKWLSINSLHLDMETGVGLADGQGEDPKVMMKASKDGGRNFGVERWASMGALGKTKTRPRWNRLGAARDWVFEFRITDPVPRCIIGAYAEITPGMH